MEELLTKHASAVFALIGAIIGASLTGFVNYLIKTKESKLRLIEKLLDKKLAAHEELINLVGLIRTMVLLGGQDVKGELKRCPIILQSPKNMDEFLEQLMNVQNKCGMWFSTQVKREVSFLLDYYINLYEMCKECQDEPLRAIGVIVRNDFIKISLDLENAAHEFFNSDMLKLNYKTDRDWHKFRKGETLSKLDQTEFYLNKQTIREIIENSV